MPTLVQPGTTDLWKVSHCLIAQYAASLPIDLPFQCFDQELQRLASEYGPPDGVFLLAKEGEAYVGCGGLRRFSPSACEMKRLYVIPAHQHQGIGRILITALIDHARNLGYTRILLDTLPFMTTAQSLYKSLGFEPVAEYRFNPVPGTIFLQLML
ncbi:MAG: GNAT family N-acetyltransferase [Nitrospira sp.]|nr:GNAT family N-acetyltransferase [Nitrospira sp.]